MKKLSIILSILIFGATTSYAQRKMQQLDEDEAKKQEQLKAYEGKKRGFDKDKMVYGGNVGLAFSNGGTFVLAQPMVGYRVLPKTILGTGGTYIYQSIPITANTKINTNAFGPILFVQQEILPIIFAHAEWQPINYERFRTLTVSERVWSNQLFIGGGYGGTGAQIFLLYNLLYDEQTSFYRNSPWFVRVGFMF
jgi:hypothetical protein